MIKLNKIALLVATAAVATATGAQEIHNWRATDGSVWKNGTNEYCWRDSSWTPATAAQGCDGALAPKVMAAPAPMAPKAAPAPMAPKAAAPAPAPAPAAPAKVTYAADAFFDFDKAVVKAEGKTRLDALVEKLAGVDLEVLVAVGHADATGPDSYNQKLSERRAAAVKAYLVSKGVDANRVYTEGKGEASPVASNSTRAGRAKNRRVEVEVVGARK
jgi:OmpA-OmpF porin, OOP family